MLSQDEGFIAAAQSITLPSVPWYKERILQNISLGALLVIVMVRPAACSPMSMSIPCV